MGHTSSRLLQLLSLLQSRRHWRGEELAARLEVSQRTLRRDIEELRELGYPVDGRRGGDGGYQLVAGASLPPLLLEDAEAVALAVGLLSAVQGGHVSAIEETSVRALAKVLNVMPSRLRRQTEALAKMTVPGRWGDSGSSVDSALLATTAEACRDEERLDFGYVDRAGTPSRRHVEPSRLVLLGRQWYLVAFDLDRFDWRSFRMDRVASAARSGTRSIHREIPGGDAAEFVRRGIENLPAPVTVEAIVNASAQEVRKRIGSWASIDEVNQHSCHVRISADTADWAVLALGATGATFLVERPRDIAAQLRGWSVRFGQAAGASTSRK